jgi:glutamate dehydrogenase
MLNTDAVDNSGGVSTSDHEVNIKILMDMLVKSGKLAKEQRNSVLAEMTDEVAALVLQDNQRQALALSLDSLRSAERYEEFVAYVDEMVSAGVLSRADDAIPAREELLASAQRARGLPRPLLAVLLGHTKLFAFQQLLETDFPDGAAGRPFQFSYFPKRLRENYHEEIGRHTLRREIVATGAVNAIVNQAGVTFLSRLAAASRAGISQVVAAYFEVDRGTDAPSRRERILGSGGEAQQRQRALLGLEQRIETLVRARLDGDQRPLANALDAAAAPARP